MQASDLIANLQNLIDVFGDHDIAIRIEKYGYHQLYQINCGIDFEYNEQKNNFEAEIEIFDF
jgi:hypothetical protein